MREHRSEIWGKFLVYKLRHVALFEGVVECDPISVIMVPYSHPHHLGVLESVLHQIEFDSRNLFTWGSGV